MSLERGVVLSRNELEEVSVGAMNFGYSPSSMQLQLSVLLYIQQIFGLRTIEFGIHWVLICLGIFVM